jgi:hypothetical protein
MLTVNLCFIYLRTMFPRLDHAFVLGQNHTLFDPVDKLAPISGHQNQKRQDMSTISGS